MDVFMKELMVIVEELMVVKVVVEATVEKHVGVVVTAVADGHQIDDGGYKVTGGYGFGGKNCDCGYRKVPWWWPW
ncbi:hypothetical protein Bca52824_036035 [Brassica carinata]|uniref:Uncharacterized protein n=1 Tax=Brassica carinata TaxID=52824 RepID=A0A8X7S4H4_BRACI|nr:hypothetical protein Bca52824_036035 [Brassica carinata]